MSFLAGEQIHTPNPKFYFKKIEGYLSLSPYLFSVGHTIDVQNFKPFFVFLFIILKHIANIILIGKNSSFFQISRHRVFYYLNFHLTT